MRPKYGNKKSVFCGEEFDSKNEGKRYLFLRGEETAGRIRNLRKQVKYELIPKQTELVPKQLKTKVKYEERCVEQAAYYIADFVYEKEIEGEWKDVVEDVKGSEFTVTDKARLQKKLMLFRHGIKVRYVFKATEPI